ncbi:chemotaxis protein CheB [Pontibacter burrus]|uniref:protein-glutamate methylesterase n=1 Tax=Pontibacter burrus TaxID=2704466 RepID=A0A6B3LZQ6_9BACT|nr:chemotaxis protein CheB [Pontibacter burrus]NEM98984.1 chemotaxis protein CheB [Pontibacter burrus]
MCQAAKIKVLLADQSSYSRLVLANILEADPAINVAGCATDAESLLKLVKKERPDVVLLNYSLPGNKHLFALKLLSSAAAVPVVLMVKKQDLNNTMLQKAVSLGVHSFILKPAYRQYPDYRSIGSHLLKQVKAVYNRPEQDMQYWLTGMLAEANAIVAKADLPEPLVDTVIVIGASTGGTQALEEIVKALPDKLNAAVLAAVHMPAGLSKSLVERLQRQTSLTVKEGRSGLLLRKNKLIVAPGGRNMIIHPVLGNTGNYKIGFVGEEAQADEIPSVDLLMQSVAAGSVKNVLGIVLTGMGKDGTKGATAIRKRGGTIVVQDQATSKIFGMARSVIRSGEADVVLPLQEIPQFIHSFVANEIAAGATSDTL